MHDQTSATRPQSAVTLVLGGARSGKSRFAHQLAERYESSATPGGRGVLFLATATAGDAHMEAKIARHRDERPARWATVEEPLQPARVLTTAGSFGLVLLDCLTFFVANHLMRPDSDADATLARESDALCQALIAPPCSVVLVSNEVGSGVVPPTELGGRFRDALGELNRRVAALASAAVLMVAGLPLPLKGEVAR